MKNLIKNSEYVLDPHSHIWTRPGYGGIAYSDGDEIELRIASIIEQASDTTVLSTELRQHCTDWPSLYHLSGTRANILRPFAGSLAGDILEIGAGCGAITRYLGECGANVLALEGSPRRAAIARSRTSDLENVAVLAEKFDSFQCDHKFDVITLIGVLEYANLFTPAENPALAMLQQVRSLLKPDGKLIIAIENQLGLKYFAGAPEDHLGQAMYGIEGRYRKDQPQTFGRKVLAGMLEQAGFVASEFLAPFPDYKLPVSILTEKGINNGDFDSAAFAWQSARRDPQLPPYCGFSLELAWPDVFKNGMALDLANSFLIISSPTHQRSSDSDAEVLAYHYSTDRVPQYCKETRFEVSANRDIKVVYNRLGAGPQNAHVGEDPVINFDCPETDKYSSGKVMSWEFVEIVTRDGWTVEEVGEFLQRYISILEHFLIQAGITLSVASPEVRILGKYFDLIPQNIIILADGSPVIIDTEWSLREDMELGQLLFRGLLLMVGAVTRFGQNATGRTFSRGEFVQSALEAAGFALTEKEFSRFIAAESTVQEQVTGRSAREFLAWWPHQPLPKQNLAQALAGRDGQISSLNQVVAERDGGIASLNQVVAERDGQIASLNQAVDERDVQITNLADEVVRRGEWALRLEAELNDERARILKITQSNSWRITLPLREGRRWISNPKQQAKMYVKRGLRWAKRLYQSLPLSHQTKVAHRNALTKHLPKLLLVSGSHSATIPVLSLPPVIKQATLEQVVNSADFAISIAIPASQNPLVTVVIPIYGQIDYTLRCLASIVANPPQVAFEVIVVDDCSPDNSAEVLAKVKGIRLIRNPQNQGFIRSCNFGANAAQGDYLYFLNNDTEVTLGWMDELVCTFREFPGTGLAGSKLVYPDGRLQEAGGIIWQDGSAWNFGRFQDPLLPVFNYAREVDYCSGASIMVPKVLFDELGGFDEHYMPAYCEDADLALKIRDKGYRVIYQPLSTVFHYEGVTSGTDTSQGTKAYQVENTKKLYERWKSRLQLHQTNGTNVDNAKDRRATRRVLVIDHCTPTPNQDSGSIDTYNIMLLLREMDFQVTFIPEDNFLYMSEYTTALQRAGIEVLYAPYYSSVEQHLNNCGDRYDLAFLFRPVVAERHMKAIRKFCPKAKVLFHTVDLHFLRMMRDAELNVDQNKTKAAEEMKQLELALITSADIATVVSTQELMMLSQYLPKEKVRLLPYSRYIEGTKKGFNERRDIVFVGGYQHTPNVDAVQYFVAEIMPLLRQRLPGARFYAVGSKPPAEIQALASEDVIIAGFVEDLTPLLDKMRVSVAPLRYGAGIKGKIGSAMAVGLPVVATTLAAEGMSLTNGENVMVADGAEQFADAIVRLYQDEELWNRISHNGLEFAENAWGAEAAWKILSDITADLGMNNQRGKRKLSLYSNDVAFATSSIGVAIR